MAEPIRLASIALFAEKDWGTWKRLLPDRSWQSSWSEWRPVAEKAVQHAQASGYIAVQVQVDPDEFVAWCRANGRDVDGRALQTFGNDLAVRAYRESQGGEDLPRQ